MQKYIFLRENKSPKTTINIIPKHALFYLKNICINMNKYKKYSVLLRLFYLSILTNNN